MMPTFLETFMAGETPDKTLFPAVSDLSRSDVHRSFKDLSVGIGQSLHCHPYHLLALHLRTPFPSVSLWEGSNQEPQGSVEKAMSTCDASRSSSASCVVWAIGLGTKRPGMFWQIG